MSGVDGGVPLILVRAYLAAQVEWEACDSPSVINSARLLLYGISAVGVSGSECSGIASNNSCLSVWKAKEVPGQQ